MHVWKDITLAPIAVFATVLATVLLYELLCVIVPLPRHARKMLTTNRWHSCHLHYKTSPVNIIILLLRLDVCLSNEGFNFLVF